jgi:uncharacterized protein YgbK (DUF1537 family)
MSHHPVTPMDEADIRLHLSRQTELPVELMDVLKLDRSARTVTAGPVSRRKKLAETLLPLSSILNGSAPIVLFDTLQETHLPVIGQFIAGQLPRSGPLFCAGSSGIEYALVAHWRESGLLPTTATVAPRPASTRQQVIAVSGSCSPVTDRQIGRAAESGFVEIACDSRMLADRDSQRAGIADALARAREALEAGRNVIFQTARGPADIRRAAFERLAKNGPGATKAEKLALAGKTLSHGLAQILEAALRRTGARRAVICGGDTSTHIARAQGIEALEFVAPVAPGGPLCRVHAPGRLVHGCEIIFKGGQVGRDSFFLDLVNGKMK